MTGTTDPARMSAERKVADAIILERAANVLDRHHPSLSGWWARFFLSLHIRFMENLAVALRAEADEEWEKRDWKY